MRNREPRQIPDSELDDFRELAARESSGKSGDVWEYARRLPNDDLRKHIAGTEALMNDPVIQSIIAKNNGSTSN